MTISTFSELKTAISDWYDENQTPDAVLSDMVMMSTDLFNNGYDDGMVVIDPLRVREMQEVVDLTPVDGSCDLPDDYLQYRRVVEKTSCRRDLRYIAMTSVEQIYPARESGLSNCFTIVGGELFMFPVSSNTIELTYYQSIPNLAAADDTNWLLAKRPMLYLHAGLFFLGLYRRDNEMVTRSVNLVKGLLKGLSKSNFSSEYARASTRLRIAP